jgi:SlyX protein
MNDEKWTEIDIRLAYQEKTIKDLSSALYGQQKRIDALEKSLKQVKDRVKAVSIPDTQTDILDEKPPHY